MHLLLFLFESLSFYSSFFDVSFLLLLLFFFYFPFILFASFVLPVHLILGFIALIVVYSVKFLVSVEFGSFSLWYYLYARTFYTRPSDKFIQVSVALFIPFFIHSLSLSASLFIRLVSLLQTECSILITRYQTFSCG